MISINAIEVDIVKTVVTQPGRDVAGLPLSTSM